MKEDVQQSFIDYRSRIEALLFAMGEPLQISKIASILNISISACRAQLEELASINNDEKRGLMVIFLEDSVQLITKPIFSSDIEKVIATKSDQPLSQASLETLVIIAYNQPVTKSFIEQLRGVNSNNVVNSLIDKGLVEEAGRLDLPGRPVSLKTTNLFLRSFSLSSLDNLPDIDSTTVKTTD